MKTKHNITRRAAFRAALGLAAAPLLRATAASARGGPDPWKPRGKKTRLEDIGHCDELARRPKLGGPHMR